MAIDENDDDVDEQWVRWCIHSIALNARNHTILDVMMMMMQWCIVEDHSHWHIKIEMVFFELQFSFPFCSGAMRAMLLAHCLMFVRRNINSGIRPEGELWCEASGQEIKLLMCGLQRQYI